MQQISSKAMQATIESALCQWIAFGDAFLLSDGICA